MSEERDNILFVCTANICRSPMAERLMRHALDAEDEPLRRLNVASAGVAACAGEKASSNAIMALKKVNLSLSDHRSRPVSEELIRRALAIFCMTDSHLAMLNYRFEKLPEHLYLMREFLDENVAPNIPDPYGMGLLAYEACRDSMVEAIPSIVRFLKKLLVEK